MQKSAEISAEIRLAEFCNDSSRRYTRRVLRSFRPNFAYSIVRRLASKSCFQDSAEFYKNIFRNACGVPLNSCMLGPPTKIAFEFMHAELYRSCCGVSACWACWLLNELLHRNYAEASAGKLACRLLQIFYKSPRAEFYGDAGRIYVVKMSMHSRIFFCFRVACRIQFFVHPPRLDHDWFMWDSRSRSLLAEILHAQFYNEFGQPFLTI